MKTLTKQESVKIMREHLNKDENISTRYFTHEGCCLIGRLLQEVCDNDIIEKIKEHYNGSSVFNIEGALNLKLNNLTGISINDLDSLQLYNDRNEFKNLERLLDSLSV